MPGCRTWQEVAGAGAGLLLNRDSAVSVGLNGLWSMTSGSLYDLTRKNPRASYGATPPVWSTHEMGRDVDFSQSSSALITVPDNANLNPTSTITFAAWVRPTDLTGPGYPAVFDKSRNSQYGMFIKYEDPGVYTDQVRLVMNIGGVRTDNYFAPGFVLGRYYLVLFTYDGANVRGYVNGTLKYTVARSGAIGTAATDLHIGHTADGWSAAWGQMYSLGIWSRPLSDSEILALYNPATRFDIYWRKSRSAPKNTVAAPATTFGFLRDNAGLGAMGGGPFSRSNAGLGVLA